MGEVVLLSQHRQDRSRAPRARDRVVSATFYYDLYDAETYLAAERVDHGFAGLQWRPAMLRAVAHDASVQPARRVLALASQRRRAQELNMPLVLPDDHPAPVGAAMRAAMYAAEVGRGAAFVLAASRLAFCGGYCLDDPEVLAEAAAAASLGLRECLDAAGDHRRDLAMLRTGRQLLAAGGDRLPALRVGRTMFCGEEQIPAAAAAHAAAPACGHAGA